MMSTTAGASLEGKSSVNTTKTQKLLYMFNILKEQGWIRKADVIGELGISDLAFWRYIQEIRSFFFDFYLPYELIYERGKNRYVLVDVSIH